jgi:hypothetical protein
MLGPERHQQALVRISTKIGTTRKRLILSLLWGVAYTLGFHLAFLMSWVDFKDDFHVIESIISNIGQVLLRTLYAPIIWPPLLRSFWLWPYLVAIGFCPAWLILWLCDYLRNRKLNGV